MPRALRLALAIWFISWVTVWTSADQVPPLNKVMREKLARSQAILAAVVNSNWNALDSESRALAVVVRDPAWVAALTEPEYLKQSDAFSRALQDLIETSARRDVEAAGNAYLSLTATCVRCHVYMSRRRIAR
jgi:hypothetical protein